MNRLTEHDWNLGPLTVGRTSWRAWRLAWSSQGGGEDESPKWNTLTIYAFGWAVRLLLLPVLNPLRIKRIASSWDAATIQRLGRNWYYEVHPREYGFCLSEGHLSIYLGAQTGDSSTTQDWSCFLPWTQWRHVRRSFYDENGVLFGAASEGTGWDEEYRLAERCPTVSFVFEDYDGQRIVAKTRIEEREWRFGAKWCRWLSVFRHPKIRRSLDLQFSAEVGCEKGSWKGGTLGHGIEMLPSELHEAAFRRYCAQEHRSKSGPFKITFVGKAA